MSEYGSLELDADEFSEANSFINVKHFNELKERCAERSNELARLRAELDWKDSMLERAKAELDRIVAHAPATEAEEALASKWLSDLEKGGPQ